MDDDDDEGENGDEVMEEAEDAGDKLREMYQEYLDLEYEEPVFDEELKFVKEEENRGMLLELIRVSSQSV